MTGKLNRLLRLDTEAEQALRAAVALSPVAGRRHRTDLSDRPRMSSRL
jgi:hypothetical protein